MKIYEYKGKHYSNTPLEDDDYGGDLHDLYWELKQDGKCGECTVYYARLEGKDEYFTPTELIESEFSDLVIEEKESDT